MVIVVSGSQATGKTTMAMALGRALCAPVFSRDPLMTVLYGKMRWPRALRRRVPATGLELQTALLSRQLELGQPAVLECIAPLAIRQQWRELTLGAGQQFVSVECVCSDVAEHRARFEQRQSSAGSRGSAGGRGSAGSRGSASWQGSARRRGSAKGRAMTWDDVVVTMRRYQSDQHADFVADAVRPIADLVADIVDLVRSSGP